MSDAPNPPAENDDFESRWSELDKMANAAWTDELRAVNTIEATETKPCAYCETCERNITGEDRTPHAAHEVLDYLAGEVTDPLSSFIGLHSRVITHDDGRIMCSCCESFDGPVYWRNHVAVVVRAYVLAELAAEQIDAT